MLKINELVVGYPTKSLLNIEKLSVESGEIVALIGKSGCGKSTLFSTIAGHLEPLKGGFTLDGNKDILYIKDNIALTLQGFPLFHWLTVLENLKMATKIKGAKDIDFYSVLKQFNAEHIANDYPLQLSGGERCRASLAQAVLTQPSLLMLDEPFTGLDTITKNAISRNIFSFTQKNDTSVIMITHDIHDAISYAKKIIILGQKSDETLTEIVKIFDSNEDRVYEKIISTLEKEYN